MAMAQSEEILSPIQSLADESQKTKKVREKLRQHLKDMEQQITKSALERKTIEIHRWLARHSDSRIVLRTRNIEIYGLNPSKAKLSKKVTSLIDRLKENIPIDCSDK